MAGQRPPHPLPPARPTETTPPPPAAAPAARSEEIGGPEGKEPTRYGDWESKGICRDF